MGLGNPASHCRQVQAHPTHCCVACAASYHQKGSLAGPIHGMQTALSSVATHSVTSYINLLDEQHTLQQQKNVSSTSSYLTHPGAVKFPLGSRASHSKWAVGCPCWTLLWETPMPGACMALWHRGGSGWSTWDSLWHLQPNEWLLKPVPGR